ncbi:alcohol dehydrogenase catalytic domain-containing protein [Rhizobium sp. NPDC090279]|uniref:alcohol dehydrogenase catalytic domain-containing protein n=1 Tax=Rhizobium sp. NPDC090279 TaxID=3364499 RepID=UPI00383A6FE2
MPQPGSGEVLIQVFAFSLDEDDLLASNPVSSDRIVGKGAAGKIVAVGEDVPAWRLGDVVIVDPGLGSREGTAGLFGIDRDGGAAEFIAVAAADACPISPDLPIEALPLLAFNYSLAERVLTWARLYKGERILVLGADSGSGAACVELALLRGANVYIITGKSVVWPFAELPVSVWAGSIPEYDGPDVHVIADFRKQASYQDCSDFLLPQGVYTSSAGDLIKPCSKPVSALVEPDIFTMETLEHLARFAEAGELKPRPSKLLSFESIEENLADFDFNSHIGPLVIRFGEG